MLIRTSLIAAGALAASMLAFQPQAEAGPKIGIYVGGYGHAYYGKRPIRHGYWPRHRWRGPHAKPYYPRPYYAAPVRYVWPAPRIRRSLRNRGFYRIRNLRFTNGYWRANAYKNGYQFRIKVNPYNGAIVRRHLI